MKTLNQLALLNHLALLKALFLLSSLSLIPASHCEAQWRKVFNGPGSFIAPSASCYMDSSIWVASDELIVSTDLGKTWRSLPWSSPVGITYDIQFFDRLHGAIASTGGTFTTSDGGVSWNIINADGATSVCYGRNINEIAAALRSTTTAITTDGGTNWNPAPAIGGEFSFCVRRSPDGSIVSFQGTSLGGHLLHSSDGGLTWSTSKQGIDWDSYTFSADSCDRNTYYVSNEDLVAPTDEFSSIFITKDFGTTWINAISNPRVFFNGSIAVTKNAVYAPTTTDGIYRSTDDGVTWRSIGGPNTPGDKRLICAITDNLLIVADSLGNIWRTTNSGGDSVIQRNSPPTLSKLAISFQTPTFVCSEVSDNISMVASCKSARFVQGAFSGVDASAFSMQQQNGTITVSFRPSEPRPYFANLLVAFDNGDTIRIPVSGTGKGIGWTSFSSIAARQDTIGGSVYLPIIAHDAGSQGDLRMHIEYDTTSLVYLGTWRGKGPAVDQSIVRSPGNAVIELRNVASASSDSIIAYAQFSVYPRSTECTTVNFDSIKFTNSADRTCTIFGPEFTNTICWTAACGTPTLSDFLRYSKLPSLRIDPNPATDWVEVRTDGVPQDASLEIFDGLGRSEKTQPIRIGEMVRLNLHGVTRGVHIVRLATADRIVSTRIVLR